MRRFSGRLHPVAGDDDTQNATVATDHRSLPLFADPTVFAGLTAGDYYLAVSGRKNVVDPNLGLLPGAGGVFDPSVSHSGSAGRSTGAYVLNLGTVPYREAWDLQRSLAGAVSQGAIPDTIVLLEHPPVITLGRRTEEGRELHVPPGAEVDVVETDRGGKSTYHGPGQLVAYPILDLRRYGKDVKVYVRNLEEALIRTLAAYELDPGVGVESRRCKSGRSAGRERSGRLSRHRAMRDSPYAAAKRSKRSPTTSLASSASSLSCQL